MSLREDIEDGDVLLPRDELSSSDDGEEERISESESERSARSNRALSDLMTEWSPNPDWQNR